MAINLSPSTYAALLLSPNREEASKLTIGAGKVQDINIDNRPSYLGKFGDDYSATLAYRGWQRVLPRLSESEGEEGKLEQLLKGIESEKGLDRLISLIETADAALKGVEPKTFKSVHGDSKYNELEISTYEYLDLITSIQSYKDGETPDWSLRQELPIENIDSSTFGLMPAFKDKELSESQKKMVNDRELFIAARDGFNKLDPELRSELYDFVRTVKYSKANALEINKGMHSLAKVDECLEEIMDTVADLTGESLSDETLEDNFRVILEGVMPESLDDATKMIKDQILEIRQVNEGLLYDTSTSKNTRLSFNDLLTINRKEFMSNFELPVPTNIVWLEAAYTKINSVLVEDTKVKE